jgi:ABC-type Fe3+/spermidine/putrescine transport system ATPase subunit
LCLEHVGKTYGHGPNPFVAVADVSLTVRAGEFVCLLGPSGCGKSTLLRMIAGLIPSSTGRLLYGAAPIHGVNPHAAIVFQTFALYPWLSVLENVERLRKRLQVVVLVGVITVRAVKSGIREQEAESSEREREREREELQGRQHQNCDRSGDHRASHSSFSAARCFE